MDKKLKLIFLSLVLVLLFMPMASALFGRCRTDADCSQGYRCIKEPGKTVGKCTSESAMRRAGWGREGEFKPVGFEKVAGGLKSIGSWALGHPLDRIGFEDLRWFLLYAIVFLMLGYAFYDIISLFGVWKFDNTPKILGFGLAGIVALSGLMAKIIVGMFGLIALYGAMAVGFSLVFAFACWFVLHHFLFTNIKAHIRSRILKAEEEVAEGKVEKALSGIKLFAGAHEKLNMAEKKFFVGGWKTWIGIGLGLILLLIFVAYVMG